MESWCRLGHLGGLIPCRVRELMSFFTSTTRLVAEWRSHFGNLGISLRCSALSGVSVCSVLVYVCRVCFGHFSLGFVLSVSVCSLSRGSSSSLSDVVVGFQLLSLGVESYIGRAGLRRLGRCLGLFCTPLLLLCCSFFSSVHLCVCVRPLWSWVRRCVGGFPGELFARALVCYLSLWSCLVFSPRVVCGWLWRFSISLSLSPTCGPVLRVYRVATHSWECSDYTCPLIVLIQFEWVICDV